MPVPNFMGRQFVLGELGQQHKRSSPGNSCNDKGKSAHLISRSGT